MAQETTWQPPPPNPTALDWIRMSSGEWLAGEILVLRDDDFEFDSEDLDGLTLDWRDIVENPSSFMFFGAPLSSNRAFDSIFKKLSTASTMHRRFLGHYAEHEGDVVSCLALLDAYTFRRLAVLQKATVKQSADAKV